MTRAGIYWFWPDPVAEIAGLEKNSIYDSTKPVCATVPTESALERFSSKWFLADGSSVAWRPTGPGELTRRGGRKLRISPSPLDSSA